MLRVIKTVYKNCDKKILFSFLSLYLLVIISMIIQIFDQNYHNAFLCVLVLILFLIPYLIDKKTKISLPDPLEIMILFFIFSTTILGEVRNFYSVFPYWDLILHTLSGFLSAAIGFSLVNVLNSSNHMFLKLSPIFVCVVALCFSMTIGVLWEFFEFAGDRYFHKDMQKDEIVTKISSVKLNSDRNNIPVRIEDIDQTIIYSNHYQNVIKIDGGYLDIGLVDTMEDLFFNLLGAIFFSIFGFIYIKKKKDGMITELFVLTLKEQV